MTNKTPDAAKFEKIYIRTMESDIKSIKNRGGGKPKPYKLTNQKSKNNK